MNISLEEKKEQEEPYEEKMARLSAELSLLFDQSDKLQADIKNVLNKLGFKV